MKKILIIGGVAGGATAAARLRRLDEKAQIILFERGEYISYANCGLPYYIGGVITDEEDLTLATPESFKGRYALEIRVRHEVLSIDRAKKEVRVRDHASGSTYSESYDDLVLSPGAEPVRIPIPGADDERVFTLRSLPDTFRIRDFVSGSSPKTAVVIGGGYIGIEMAENLHAKGLDVSIVEKMSHLIGPLDEDMCAEVHRHIRAKGVHLYLASELVSISRGGAALQLQLSGGVALEADMVVMSVGVRPEVRLAREAGLGLGALGGITVDEHMRTSDAHIYAVGDAVETRDVISGKNALIPLASPANRQGRIAADNICGVPSVYGGAQGTAILKAFDMTVAVTGLNESRLRNVGIPYEKSFTFSASHATYYPGATFMSVKLLFEKPGGRILGAQITGHDGVDKRMDVIATAIRAGMDVAFLTGLELAYAPPFGSAKDPVNMAGYVACNILDGSVAIFHWHDVDALERAAVNLLDVRTKAEFEKGSIAGARNIPLDQLRERLGELDRSKPVFLFCQIGLRGYIAARLLSGHGFDVKNLSGGFRLYSVIKAEGAASPNAQNITRKADKRTMELSEKGK